MGTGGPGKSSDVEQPYPGRADVELVVVELGLDNHVATAAETHFTINTVTGDSEQNKSTVAQRAQTQLKQSHSKDNLSRIIDVCNLFKSYVWPRCVVCIVSCCLYCVVLSVLCCVVCIVSCCQLCCVVCIMLCCLYCVVLSVLCQYCVVLSVLCCVVCIVSCCLYCVVLSVLCRVVCKLSVLCRVVCICIVLSVLCCVVCI